MKMPRPVWWETGAREWFAPPFREVIAPDGTVWTVIVVRPWEAVDVPLPINNYPSPKLAAIREMLTPPRYRRWTVLAFPRRRTKVTTRTQSIVCESYPQRSDAISRAIETLVGLFAKGVIVTDPVGPVAGELPGWGTLEQVSG